LTPVLEVQKHIEEDPAAKAIFTNARDELIPNPAVYTDWFERSPEHDQKRVVGARRMNMLRSLLPNEKITWGHFVDPDTGRLLDEQELYRETQKKTGTVHQADLPPQGTHPAGCQLRLFAAL
jgi:hypothetical protein